MKLLILFMALTLASCVMVGAQEPAAPQNGAAPGTPADRQKNAASATQDNSGISGDQVTKPAGAKGSTLIGCLSGPDKAGNYSLHSMQHREGVEVLGPEEMQKSVGNKVKLTGTWQAVAAQPSAAKSARRFQATQVEVISQGCQAPSATTPVSKKKQEQRAISGNTPSGEQPK